MADRDANVQVTSGPYDYPRPLSDPIPRTEEVVEKQNEERVKDQTETTVDLNEDNNEDDDESPKDDEQEDEEEEKNKETKKPLLEDDSVKIDIKPYNDGEDTPTLPLPDKKKQSIDGSEIERKQKEKLPVYLFPFTRIKDAWTDSSNIFQFIGAATCIIFQTVGWFACVGGIPFASIVMLVIGSIYLYDCNIEPNIPVYLIVSGVFGTIQHVLTVWTKYVPRESQGRLKVYRSYCNLIHGIFHLFLLVWFIVGCVWVYGAFSEVDYQYPEKREYCHKTLYLFSFWMLNLSFILLGLLVFLSICFLICKVATDK